MKKALTLLLCLWLLACLGACGSTGRSDQGTASTAESTAATSSLAESIDVGLAPGTSTAGSSSHVDTGSPSADIGTDINIAVLSGPTGIGAVGLMIANDSGETVNHYNFTVASANDEIASGLSSGEFDIAAVATNLAAGLYNKTSGGVRILALNTLGVLYILENGDTIDSISDLREKTVYATGQGANPEYVLEYLLTLNGLSYSVDGSDADVRIEFLASDAVSSGMVSGEYDVCMLPVPAVTSVLMQNQDVRLSLDLTEVWNSTVDRGQLTMGCIVVRTEFAAQYPGAVEAFLTEYAQSVDSALEDPASTGTACETYGIVARAAVAETAIPYCNLCYITGADIRPAIEPYYTVLYEANPDSIGGALPGDDFYYTAAD